MIHQQFSGQAADDQKILCQPAEEVPFLRPGGMVHHPFPRPSGMVHQQLLEAPPLGPSEMVHRLLDMDGFSEAMRGAPTWGRALVSDPTTESVNRVPPPWGELLRATHFCQLNMRGFT